MRIPRKAVAVLAAVASTGLMLTGCNAGGAADRGAVVAAPEDPKQTLAKATTELAKGNYSFTTEAGPDKTTGDIHLPESALLKIFDSSGQPGTHVLAVGPERYIKLKSDLGEDLPDAATLESAAKRSPKAAKAVQQLKDLQKMFGGKHWMHLDLSKLKDAETFDGVEDPDATGATLLLKQAATAERQGAAISGVLDVTTAPADQLPWDSAEIKQMGAAAKALPYTAMINGQGHLTKLVIEVPKIGKAEEYRYLTEISRYGQAKTQPKPATDEIVEMSPKMYELINQQ